MKNLFLILLVFFISCKDDIKIVTGKLVTKEYQSPYSILGNRFGEGYMYDVYWLSCKSTNGIEYICKCVDTSIWNIGDTINKYDDFGKAIK